MAERSKLTKEAVDLAKELVRARDGNICQHCGKWCEGSGRHVSHVRPESAGTSLRWNPTNMKVLCYHCHINWWHKNPLESGQWFRDKFPDRAKFIDEYPHYEDIPLPTLREQVEALRARVREELPR